jgi:hypothetical protein
MAFNPNDYDEVYETRSEPEKAQLLGIGWVLLDERFETAGGEPLWKSWERSALRYTGGGRFWSGAAGVQLEPDAPHEDTTYVLGWPKGQQTISEDEFEKPGSGAGDSAE